MRNSASAAGNAAKTVETAGAYLSRLMGRHIMLRLIPLARGEKRPATNDWATESASRDLNALIRNGAKTWNLTIGEVRQALQLPLPEWAERGYNIGVVHEWSNTIAFDMDDPRAVPTIQAGVELVTGVKGFQLDVTPFCWRSVRGTKWLWKRPTDIPSVTRPIVIRNRNELGEIRPTTIVEFRASGQDLIPPGRRKDEPGFLVDWVNPLPEDVALPEMPPELLAMVKVLFDPGHVKHKALMAHMVTAAGGEIGLLDRTPETEDEYPPALAACVHERGMINSRFDVEDLLLKHGYERKGSRWSKPGTKHASGIAPPNPDKGYDYWKCWHSNSPLFGRFDAWRIFVTLEHKEELAAARAAVKAMPRLVSLDAMPGKGSRTPPEPPTGVQATSITTTSFQPVVERSDGPALEPSIHAVPGVPDIVNAQRFSVADLLDADLPEPRMVTGGSIEIPTGCFLLTAQPKIGKSWFAQGLALLLGGDIDEYCGMKRAGDPCEVFYISMDDATKATLKQRLHKLIGDRRATRNVNFVNRWPDAIAISEIMAAQERAPDNEMLQNLDPEDRIDALKYYLITHPNCKVVIVDTLMGWREMAGDNAVAKREYDEIKALQTMATEFDAMVLVVHYNNKGASQRQFDWSDPQTAVAGTTALQGATDGMMILHYSPTDTHEHAAAFWFIPRAVRGTDLGLNLVDGRWEVVADSALGLKTLDEKDCVIEYFLALPESEWHVYRTAKDIHAEIGSPAAEMKKDTFAKMLQRMARKGGPLISNKSPVKGKGGFLLDPGVRTELRAKRKY